MDNLEYAEMLEIPVSTVNVVKKRGLFRRKNSPAEDLKDDVLASVNSRAEEEQPQIRADFVQTEDLSQPPAALPKKRDGLSVILLAEAVAACLLAGGIFLTNALVENTAINNMVAGLSRPAEQQVNYTDLELSPVVSSLSDVTLTQTAGAITFTGTTAVYPVCDGTVCSVSVEQGLYTVEIAHTQNFSSVFTGLSDVYVSAGESVRANVPVAYSNGSSQVALTLYDQSGIISGYTLEGALPVWTT